MASGAKSAITGMSKSVDAWHNFDQTTAAIICRVPGRPVLLSRLLELDDSWISGSLFLFWCVFKCRCGVQFHRDFHCEAEGQTSDRFATTCSRIVWGGHSATRVESSSSSSSSAAASGIFVARVAVGFASLQSSSFAGKNSVLGRVTCWLWPPVHCHAAWHGLRARHRLS